MKLVMVYREASEHRMAAESFMRDFKYQTGRSIEGINPDTREGAAFCKIYDIMQYPTLIAITPDGTPLATWAGTLPTISEASGY